jgi:hypothetical protein
MNESWIIQPAEFPSSHCLCYLSSPPPASSPIAIEFTLPSGSTHILLHSLLPITSKKRNVLLLSPIFARENGISLDTPVKITKAIPLSTLKVTNQISLIPVNPDDWEIISLNAVLFFY